ncbi:MAG: family 1 glycosylhydrolase [Gordonia sp. (in: high G+C Gram-positive bacteria)]|uniref:glycoside hydrolase family 1 protein n=1 Tax=Gordonia sp. (in: high G+C Gram-positive bacteria) TaxID=84139 RepID=UPI0039E4BCB7
MTNAAAAPDDARPTGSLPVDSLRGLRFSAATSAFQVEGGRDADGRGRSIWDDFVEIPGSVADQSIAEPAADSYRRWSDDVALAAGLGLDRFRFSLSWSRVLPDGAGPPNPLGLDHYSRLVDALLEAGVTPFPTLDHWGLPSALQASGGWLDRDTAYRFAEYAALVAQRLGDRVKHWYTLDEPNTTSLLGYGIGTHAPAQFLLYGALPTVHHQLLAHGLAMPVLREAGAETVGLANNHTLVLPASSFPADVAAAEAYDLVHNRIFVEPVLLGRYPDLAPFGDLAPAIHDGDLALISARPDFYGIGFYNPNTVAAPPERSPVPFSLLPTPGVPVTGCGDDWPIMPSALTALLADFAGRYGRHLPPVIISGNGAAFDDPDTAGTCDDVDRIDYLAGHLRAVAAARDAGIRVDEYTVRSLIDGFHWTDGLTRRFGLVHVDFTTAERTPRASYDWYRRVVAAVHDASAHA